MSDKILFCWSGGGLPGLDIHAGIWRALSEHGISATANAGTSAGAIMGALNSTGMRCEVMEALIRGLSDGDVKRERLLWKLRIFWISYFLEHEPIRRLLREILPLDFTDLKKPLSVFVTDEITATAREIKDTKTFPSLPEAVLASMSIMGVFPPVGNYSDGGTTENLPLPENWQKFDEVYLLIAKRPLKYSKRTGILTRTLFNADILLEAQVSDTIYYAKANHPHVYVIRPPVEAPGGSLHFDHDLIIQAYEYTRTYLTALKNLKVLHG